MRRRLRQSSSSTPKGLVWSSPVGSTTRKPRRRRGRKRRRPEARARPGRSRAILGPTSLRGSLAALAARLC
eukprot:11208556-Lingulodinium_polyedra.AAC.1